MRRRRCFAARTPLISILQIERIEKCSRMFVVFFVQNHGVGDVKALGETADLVCW